MKNKAHLLILATLLMFGIQISVRSQSVNVNPSQKNNWIQIVSDNGEISVDMPVEPVYFYDQEGFLINSYYRNYNFEQMQMLQANYQKNYMCLEVFLLNNAKDYVESFSSIGGAEIFKINGDQKEFSARKLTFDRKLLKDRKFPDNVYYELRYFASKTHLYMISVWNKNGSNEITERFLNSVRLGSNAFQANNQENLKKIKISSLKALTLGDIGNQLSKEEIKNLPENPKFDEKDPNRIFVLSAPYTGAPTASASKRPKGVVKMYVTYSKEGRISKISLISGLQGGLNRNVFFSVLRTKFLPAEKNGEPVTEQRIIKYDYTY